jgi:hypothetical protein
MAKWLEAQDCLNRGATPLRTGQSLAFIERIDGEGCAARLKNGRERPAAR